MRFKKTLCRIQISQFSSLASVQTKWYFVQMTRTFHPDAHQCLEASNSSSLHLSGGNGKSSRRSSEFEKFPVFQWICPDVVQCLTSIRVSTSRHRYGKTATTVRTMFSLRQIVHTKFNRLDVSLHGPDDQESYMEIPCTSPTVRTSSFRVRTLKALLW
jgi:hypothetical protein